MPPKSRSTTANTTARKPPAKRRAKRKRVTVRSPIKVILFQCPKCKLKTNKPWKRWFHTCLIGWTPSQKRTIAQRQASRANLNKARQARSR